MERDYEGPKYELPVDDINWTAGAGRAAGVYWLNGASVIAAHDTPAEARLVEEGAVLVATLRFDPDPVERVHHGRVVHRIAGADVRRIAAPATRN